LTFNSHEIETHFKIP